MSARIKERAPFFHLSLWERSERVSTPGEGGAARPMMRPCGTTLTRRFAATSPGGRGDVTAAQSPVLARMGRCPPGPPWSWFLSFVLASLSLLWPAFWNGYPLVFSDTGTYLSQAIQHYLGWDRPPFYSLFLLPLHMCITTWPAIAAQALLTVWVLRLVLRWLAPQVGPWRLVALTGVLAVASPLPFVVAELMPDLFTGLLTLALLVLVLAPERLARFERWGLVALVAFAMAAHLSNLPIGLGLLAVLLVLRRRLGAAAPLGRAGRMRLAAAPALAIAALVAANLAGHGRASIAPYGNVFLLARVIADGPGRDVLRRDCPRPGWALCAEAGRLPHSADAFLWRSDGPLVWAGGARRVSREADAIIRAAVAAEPWRELRKAAGNTVRQLIRFRTGDGLRPWPATVTPWLARDFPRFEQRTYATARQTRGLRVVPPGLPALHLVAALAALGLCLAALPGALRRRAPIGGLIVASLVVMVLNAGITGALSGPHARYQSRVMWLPVLAALVAGRRKQGQGAKPLGLASCFPPPSAGRLPRPRRPPYFHLHRPFSSLA